MGPPPLLPLGSLLAIGFRVQCLDVPETIRTTFRLGDLVINLPPVVSTLSIGGFVHRIALGVSPPKVGVLSPDLARVVPSVFYLFLRRHLVTPNGRAGQYSSHVRVGQ